MQTAALAFLLLLFPTGRLRSPRWRPAAWFLGGGVHVDRGVLAGAGHPGLVAPVQLVQHRSEPQVLTATLILVPAALVVSVAAVVVRFVRSSGEERLQLKWFAAAAVLVVVTLSRRS